MSRHSTEGAGIWISARPIHAHRNARVIELFGVSGTGGAAGADPADWCQVLAPVVWESSHQFFDAKHFVQK